MNTIKVDVKELKGTYLDYAVSLSQTSTKTFLEDGEVCYKVFSEEHGDFFNELYEPSMDWSQGGPLIDKYQVVFDTDPFSNSNQAPFHTQHGATIWARIPDTKTWFEGSTHLVAASKAVVAHVLGFSVDIPRELK